MKKFFRTFKSEFFQSEYFELQDTLFLQNYPYYIYLKMIVWFPQLLIKSMSKKLVLSEKTLSASFFKMFTPKTPENRQKFEKRKNVLSFFFWSFKLFIKATTKKSCHSFRFFCWGTHKYVTEANPMQQQERPAVFTDCIPLVGTAGLEL